MEYVRFSYSDQKGSRVCFGAMGLNCAFGQFEEGQLIRAVHHALDQGVSMIDTARTYGDSERILGRALKEWKGERPFVASKAAPKASKTNNGWGMPNPISISYPKGAVTESAETSLKELHIDCIDLLQLHQYWSQYEGEYWVDEMLKLKEQGKIKHIGISITDHRHDQAISIVRSGVIDSVQTVVNIFDPLAFDSLIPLCQDKKVALIARCVLDEGGLTGVLEEDTIFDEKDFREDYFRQGPLSEYVRRVNALKKYVPAYAGSIAQLAIKYAAYPPGVTTVNISMHIKEHANENIRALEEAPLPDSIFLEIRKRHRWLLNLYENKYFPSEGEEMTATGFK